MSHLLRDAEADRILRAYGPDALPEIMAMLEPIMMVFMGGSIGTILIAMYLPIFTIADTIT